MIFKSYLKFQNPSKNIQNFKTLSNQKTIQDSRYFKPPFKSYSNYFKILQKISNFYKIFKKVLNSAVKNRKSFSSEIFT